MHLNLKKYGLAAFFFSKALKYLSLDGKQNTSELKSPFKFISNHTTQKRAEVMYNLGLAFYKLKEYKKCMNYLREVLKINCNKFSAWFWMGVCCVKYYCITLEKTSLEKNENDVYNTKFNFTFPYNANKPIYSKTKKSKI